MVTPLLTSDKSSSVSHNTFFSNIDFVCMCVYVSAHEWVHAWTIISVLLCEHVEVRGHLFGSQFLFFYHVDSEEQT